MVAFSVGARMTAVLTGEPHLFVLWSRARSEERRILQDLERSFRVLDVIEVTWRADRFAENLTRFYGQSLPPGSHKERECGTGPFLLIVAEDPAPHYAKRRVTSGLAARVNVATADAKTRYRAWAGGGHAVHATLDSAEFARDLFLLCGVGVERYADAPTWDGHVRALERDLVGADGWDDVSQLVTALEVVLPFIVVGPGSSPDTLDAVVEDLWWARETANAVPISGGRHQVTVAGEPFFLEIRVGRETVEDDHARLRSLGRLLRRRIIGS